MPNLGPEFANPNFGKANSNFRRATTGLELGLPMPRDLTRATFKSFDILAPIEPEQFNAGSYEMSWRERSLKIDNHDLIISHEIKGDDSYVQTVWHYLRKGEDSTFLFAWS